MCLPLQTTGDPVGVLALTPRRAHRFDAEQRLRLDALATQAAFALERATLAREAEASALRAKTEEMRSSLLSAVSHDLRTPLASITGAVSTLRDQSVQLSRAQRDDMLDTIAQEAERLERLVANLLEVTQVESGSLRVRREWVPFEEIAGAAVARLDVALKSRPLRVVQAPDLPLLSVDPVLFQQVLVNLLENAIKYTPADSEIEIDGHAHDGAVVIEVKDRGPGIPPGDEARVFEKFYRGSHGHVAGAGLGLAICKGIVEAHGGTIDVERRAGGGAVFRVTLPFVAVMSSLDPLVLVVEDEPQMRRFIRASMEAHGYRIAEASSGADAIALATGRTPDVMLLDLGLPDGDGIDLTRRFREWSRVPIIVISARGREEDKVAALDAGADDYLTKPFSVNELLARVRVALRHARNDAGSQEATLEFGDLRIDLARREVRAYGHDVHLTPIEYKLLALLARNAGRVLTHRQIIKEVWGTSYAGQSHHVRVHMAELRKKIESDPARPQWLITEVGVGYRLRDRAPE
jgi:DNA-binding response OmpR family regulator/signal transduction histidine kinase